jgi:hypothetical protein
MEKAMKLSASVPILEAGNFHTWRIGATASDLAMLGKPRSRSSGRSVIGLKACKLSADKEFLTFELGEAALLNLGDAKDSIAILLDGPSKEASPNRSESRLGGQADANVSRLRSGDDSFIAACRSEGLPEAVVQLGQSFLTEIREFSDDKLREGMHRKWVTYPKNFLALTIQNRNQQFCVHVKHSAMLAQLSGQLDIRNDRPGYARFWLQDQSQLDAAVKAARASFVA